jgi:hypothetical protein
MKGLLTLLEKMKLRDLIPLSNNLIDINLFSQHRVTQQ